MLPCLCPILGLWAQGEVVSTSHSFLFSPSLRRREWNPDCALDIPCLSFRFSPRFTEALPQRKACTTGRREVFQADLRTVTYWSWSTLWCKCIVSEDTELYRDLHCHLWEGKTLDMYPFVLLPHAQREPEHFHFWRDVGSAFACVLLLSH